MDSNSFVTFGVDSTGILSDDKDGVDGKELFRVFLRFVVDAEGFFLVVDDTMGWRDVINCVAMPVGSVRGVKTRSRSLSRRFIKRFNDCGKGIFVKRATRRVDVGQIDGVDAASGSSRPVSKESRGIVKRKKFGRAICPIISQITRELSVERREKNASGSSLIIRSYVSGGRLSLTLLRGTQ